MGRRREPCSAVPAMPALLPAAVFVPCPRCRQKSPQTLGSALPLLPTLGEWSSGAQAAGHRLVLCPPALQEQRHSGLCSPSGWWQAAMWQLQPPAPCPGGACFHPGRAGDELLWCWYPAGRSWAPGSCRAVGGLIGSTGARELRGSPGVGPEPLLRHQGKYSTHSGGGAQPWWALSPPHMGHGVQELCLCPGSSLPCQTSRCLGPEQPQGAADRGAGMVGGSHHLRRGGFLRLLGQWRAHPAYDAMVGKGHPSGLVAVGCGWWLFLCQRPCTP